MNVTVSAATGSACGSEYLNTYKFKRMIAFLFFFFIPKEGNNIYLKVSLAVSRNTLAGPCFFNKVY